MAILTKRQHQVLRHFEENTTMHGVGHIANSRRAMRLMWTLLMLISACLLMFQIYNITVKFINHPVSTKLSLSYETPIHFPAVTICNLNPMKYSMLKIYVQNMKEKKRKRKKKDKKRKKGKRKNKKRRPGNKPKKRPKVRQLRRAQNSKNKEQRFKIQSSKNSITEDSDLYDPTLGSDNETLFDSTTEVPPLEMPLISNATSYNGESPNDTYYYYDDDDYTDYMYNASDYTETRTEGIEQAEDIFVTMFDDNVEEATTSPILIDPGATNAPRPEYRREQDLMFAMNTISASQRKNLTFDMKDLLFDCYFLNRPCTEADFVPITSARYGTCFLFNGGMNKSLDRVPLWNVSASGAESSLILSMFVNQDNYLPDISTIAGYKVIIHDSARPPIPEEEGILLMPGQLTALGVRKKIVERAEAPYGKCKHFTQEENERINMYLDQLPYTLPNVPVCMRTCEQILVIRECGCYSLSLGFANARAFQQVRGNRSYISACPGDTECARRIATDVANGRLGCKTEFCQFQACEHDMFDIGQSHAFWPAKNSFTEFAMGLTNHPNERVREAWANVTGEEEKRTFVSENFLKVKVYLTDLTVVYLKTEPSYKFLDLLSDFGGNAGLWLGLSVFTAFEICVFLFDIISAMYKTEDEEGNESEGEAAIGEGTTSNTKM